MKDKISTELMQQAKEAHARFCFVLGIKGNWDTLADREKLAWASVFEPAWANEKSMKTQINHLSRAVSGKADQIRMARNALAVAVDLAKIGLDNQFTLIELVDAAHKVYWEDENAAHNYLKQLWQEKYGSDDEDEYDEE